MAFQESLEMWSEVDSEGNNYFHRACKAGDISLIKEAGRSMTKEDIPFVTPIVCEKNNHGMTCIHITMNMHYGPYAAAIIRCLVRLGADLNAREDHGGETALHFAIRRQDHYMVEWLCRRRTINIDVGDWNMITPYHLAKRNHDQKMMFILLCCGANTNVPSDASNDEMESGSSESDDN